VRAGLYVHVPFCLTRCGYCDFNAYAGLGHLADRYIAALTHEADLVADGWRDTRFASVFLGGGTPTTLEPAQLVNLLDHLRKTFAIDADAEITIEANPDTVDERNLSALRPARFTRLSMGAQSFDEGVLLSLERVHSPDSVRRAYRSARAAGWTNLNLDLIYGAEGETLESWRATLHQTIELGPEHISAYALTIEPATPLGREVNSGTRPAPDPDLQADMFHAACELLAHAGYVHYEISNWAKPGFECVHNLGYWQGRPYLGLGAGAHSYRDARRWWNVRPPAGYLETVESGRVPIGGDERLSRDQLRLERVSLGLRTNRGLPEGEIDPRKAAGYLANGLLTRRGGSFVLTERGMLLANDLVLALA
jgi:putative oxygen-independent coproporphyrinogen III oxidase